MDICNTDYEFDTFLDVMDYFKRIINVCKQMNYSEFHSEKFEQHLAALKALLAEREA